MKPNHDDIMGCVQLRLSKDTYLDTISGDLEAEIVRRIAENIPETKLREMTDGLDLRGVYGATLERIALMWNSHLKWLLQLDELSHALAVEVGSTDLNPERHHRLFRRGTALYGLCITNVGIKTSVLEFYVASSCPETRLGAHSKGNLKIWHARAVHNFEMITQILHADHLYYTSALERNAWRASAYLLQSALTQLGSPEYGSGVVLRNGAQHRLLYATQIHLPGELLELNRMQG
ncbi:hypothetical protein HOY80DRAFT_1030517 [Tuber brumale]|nr:hypothetical protein HOY80DRAFT_1030517 [Tuber brumale]